MPQDYMEILKNFKKDLFDDGYTEEFDTISIIDELNPNLTNDSKKYRDSKKIIFKQAISEKNAKKIMDLVLDIEKYDTYTLNEYKREIRKICLNIYLGYDENPIEILIFSIKGLYGKDIYINSILDVLKSLYEENQEIVIKAYKDILNDWNFDECLDIVLKSIVELRINSIQDEVFNLLERNIRFRKQASKTLISIGARDYYESMLNLLCSQNSMTTEEISILREVLFFFANQDEINTQYIYSYYIKTYSYMLKEVNSILIAAIRKNLSKSILDDAEKRLKNNQIDNRVHRKIIRMLGRCNQNNVAIKILKDALNYSYLNRTDILGAIGGNDQEVQIQVLKNTKSSEKEKINAIIALGKGDTDISQILDIASKQSEGLKIAAHSVRVERGDKKEIIELFKYIVNKNIDENLVYDATNQIRRLRGLGDHDLNTSLLEVAKKLLENDDAAYVNRVMKIIDIFSKGIATDEIGELFINKLKSTKHAVIKIELLEFFKKEHNRFNNNLKIEIKNIVVDCTKEEKVSDNAMECLNSINKLVDATPIMNKN